MSNWIRNQKWQRTASHSILERRQLRTPLVWIRAVLGAQLRPPLVWIRAVLGAQLRPELLLGPTTRIHHSYTMYIPWIDTI